MSEKKSLEFFGMPWYVALATVAVVLIAAYTGGLSKDLLGSFALMFAIGLVFYEIGERIPLWNTYVGGGIVLAFIGTAVLVYFNLIPDAYLKSMNTVMDDQDFLAFFIAVLITGSILSLERNILLLCGLYSCYFGRSCGSRCARHHRRIDFRRLSFNDDIEIRVAGDGRR